VIKSKQIKLILKIYYI